jgi:paraquat-inducible protein A
LEAVEGLQTLDELPMSAPETSIVANSGRVAYDHQPPVIGEAQARECIACGKIQSLAETKPGYDRRCVRCGETLGSGLVHLSLLAPILVASLTIFVLVLCLPLLTIELQGQRSDGYLLTGVSGFLNYDMAPLAVFTVTCICLAPLVRLLILAYAVASVLTNRRSKYLLRLYRFAETLRPWEMLDVFLVGTLVAMTKLHDLVDVDMAAGLWCLMALVFTIALFDSMSDRHRFWDLLEAPAALPAGLDRSQLITCGHCRLLQQMPQSASSGASGHCLRCAAVLHRRKPNSIQRTWALIISAAILYVPANLYPVFTIVSFGRRNTSTIMGGVRQLMTGADWPLAVIIFIASIAVPLLKLVGLAWLLFSVRKPSSRTPHLNGRLHRLIELVGRWSATDVFVAALLCGLVMLGNLATVEPGPGVLAFGAVVVLTMIATMTFDPRLLWDAAETTDG